MGLTKGKKQQSVNTRTIFVMWLFLLFFVGVVSSVLFLSTPQTLIDPAHAASPPQIINYQGKLFQNSLAATTTQSMFFVLYDAATAGNVLYSAGGTVGTPTAISITPTSGLFTVALGDTGTNSLPDTIFRDNASVYLEVRAGGETLSPRKQILSSPYAINSRYLNGVGSKTVSTTTYIPISDGYGNFQFNQVTSTFVTSTGGAYLAGSSTLGSVYINSLTVGNGLLAYLGNTQTFSSLNTFSSGFIASASSSFASTINVAGNLNASSSLFVGGFSTLNGFNSTASSTLGGTLSVTGATTVSSSLGVSGLATLTGGFLSLASSTINAGLSVSGALNASGTFFGNATSSFARGLGIATSSPRALLTVQDGAILAVGTFGGAGGTPISGDGTRLMWIPSKSAFRAGYVNGSQWDNSNIAEYSAALGYGNTAAGASSFVAGTSNSANTGGSGSIALGSTNQVAGIDGVGPAFVFGYANTISASAFAAALGGSNIINAGSNSSITIGSSNTINGVSNALALGTSNVLGANRAIALGSSMTVNGDTSIGVNLDQNSRTLTRANTMAIMGGNVGIGTVTPAYTLSVTGTLGVSATSTFATTTAVSSTIDNGYIITLRANTATIDTLTVTSCTGCSSFSLSSNNTFTGTNTFTATTTLATTTINGYLNPNTADLFDIGASSTQWRYLNLSQGLFVNDGSTTTSLSKNQLIFAQASGYNLGKLYIDSSGNINTSGTLRVTGNILPLALPTYSAVATATSSLDNTTGAGSSGSATISTVIGADGFPVIAYQNTANLNLMVYKCGNASCSSGNTSTTVASAIANGNAVSMAIGSDGLPVIAFYNNTETKPNILKCGNAACSTGNTLTSVGSASEGTFLSLAIGVDGFPSVAVYDGGNTRVRFIKCANHTCSTNTERTVDDPVNYSIGQYLSLAISPNGNPAIAYYNTTQTSIDYALCYDPRCENTHQIVSTTIDNTADQGQYVSLAMGTDGLPTMAYYDPTFSRLLIKLCVALDCTGNNLIAQETTGQIQGTGQYPSIKIGANGFPQVAYYATTTGALRVFNCFGLSCLTSTSTLVDTGVNNTGLYPSMAIGADGRPVIAYVAELGANANLHFVQCGSYDCFASSTTALTSGSDLGSSAVFFNNIYANRFLGKKFQVSAFDLAEDYPTMDPTLGAGDVVMLDEKNPGYVMRTVDQSKAIGIVSTKPGLLLSEWENSLTAHRVVPVALAGRVPVKVSLQHGPIAVGDLLAPSNLAGVAAKWTGFGPTVGFAMEEFTATTTLDGPGTATITAFVNLGKPSTTNEQLTVDPLSKTLTIGSTTTPYNLALTGGTLSFLNPALNKLSFVTSSLLTTNLGNTAGARAFTLQALNFSPTSTISNSLLTLTAGTTDVFSAKNNGDLHILGTYYGTNAIFNTPNTPGDLAERVDVAPDDVVEPGDVMVVDPNNPDTYRRSSSNYEQAVAGVISTNPTIVVGAGKTAYTATLAMVGRVPVKVTTENGSINRGDLLVASNKKGYAMKYNPETDTSLKMVGIIGIALDPFAGADGKIPVLVRTGWGYSQAKSLNEFKESLTNLEGTIERLSVGDNGGSVDVLDGNLTLGGKSLVSVKEIKGQNDRWQIDQYGRFITRVSTSQGEQYLFAMQSPASEFVFSSSSALIGGTARVVFDLAYQELIDPDQPLKVTVTLTSGGAKGVYVNQKDGTGFTVQEVDNGTGEATFDWIVVARRKNLEPAPNSEEAPTAEAPVEPITPAAPNTKLEPTPASPVTSTTIATASSTAPASPEESGQPPTEAPSEPSVPPSENNE